MKCYKYNKVGYLAKNCRLGQKMKHQSVQKGTDNKESNKEKGFVRDLKQAQYNKPLYIINP